MRRILFSMFAGAVIFLGCSKNDNNDAPASIVGTWSVNSAVFSTYLNGALTYSDTSTEGTLQFASDGTFSADDSTGLSSGTYTYNSSTKKLTTISGGDTITANVTNLTSNNLHINFRDSSTFGSNVSLTVIDEDYKR